MFALFKRKNNKIVFHTNYLNKIIRIQKDEKTNFIFLPVTIHSF